MTRKHGGARSGAGRPAKNSPIGILNAMGKVTSREEADRLARALSRVRWTAAERKRFQRAAGIDYFETLENTWDQMWAAVLTGNALDSPDMGMAWAAYQMIMLKPRGIPQPQGDLVKKLERLHARATRALWRICVADPPKQINKAFTKIRGDARRELCRRVGIRATSSILRSPRKVFIHEVISTRVMALYTDRALPADQAYVLVAMRSPKSAERAIKDLVRMFGAYNPDKKDAAQ